MTPTTMSTGGSPAGVSGCLAAPATAAATSNLVDIDEVDAYVLRSRECANHGAQSSCGATGAADDLAHIVGADAHLEHPPATQFLVFDGDIVGMRNDPPDQMFECVVKHLGLARLRVGGTGIGSLLGLLWSALDRCLLGLGALSL